MFARHAARLCVAAFFFLSTALAGQLDKPMHEVEQVRGVKFLHEVKTATINRDQVPERLRQEMVKSLPYSLDDYMLVLKTLRFVDPASKDLVSRLLSLFESQVLAFYDPRTHIYYSIRQGAPALKELGNAATLDEVVAVHELTHALQDQRFDIGKYDEKIKADWDASLAYHSVIEGEASLVMMASLVGKMGQKLDDIANNDLLLSALSEAAGKQQIDDSAPPYFTKSLVFPYFDGLKFVVAAYRRGGWAAVDGVYGNPPRSTREILHPDDYFARVADTKAPAVPPIARVEASHILASEHLGEWHWGFLVGAENARGWLNDRVTVVENEANEPTVLAESLWDDAAHARTFADAYTKFLDEHGIDRVSVTLTGADVKVAYGADRALIARWSGKPEERPAE